MNKNTFKINPIAFVVFLALLLASCNFGRPRINGGKDGQPIMDGWTYEEAAEYWLGSVLSGTRTILPDSLARLSKGHVHLSLPVHESNPEPRFGVAYRQPKTGGCITFVDSAFQEVTHNGDTLNAIGTVLFSMADAMYRSMNNTRDDGKGSTVYVENRGKGLFTWYGMDRVRDRKSETKESGPVWHERRAPHWYGVVISVFPGGDSLLVSRGLDAVETFVAEE